MLFRYHLPLEKGVALYLNKLKIPFTQEWIVTSLVEIGTVVLEKTIFNFRQCIFRFFVIISPWKRVWPFNWTILNPHHPRMLYTKFEWYRPSGSGDEFFKISSMYFRYFVIISPWRRAWPFIWKNLIPSTQECFVPSLVKIDPVVLEKKIFKISSMYFRYFVIISPWKRAWPIICINFNPHHPRMLCAKFWNWPSGSGEEDENVKSLRKLQRRRRRRRTTDKLWSEKLRWAKNKKVALDYFLFNDEECSGVLEINLRQKISITKLMII